MEFTPINPLDTVVAYEVSKASNAIPWKVIVLLFLILGTMIGIAMSEYNKSQKELA
jgi:hypothetical protein